MKTDPTPITRRVSSLSRILSRAALLIGFTALTAQAATSISQFGITWTFDKDYPAGQFANGDHWVVGPVKIVSINPPSTTSGGRTINGSMINPAVGKAQGYDSATYATYGQSYSGNVAVGVSSSNPLTLNAGSSLVSSISHATAGNRPQLTSAAVLTVLSSAAPSGSFRPPYTGTDKTLRWNKSQLNTSLLRSLPKPTGTPTLSTVEARFERPWLDHNPDWTGRYIHPSGNMPDYGRDMSNALAEGLLSLQLDYTAAQKEKLLIRLVQYGIDVYGIAKTGGIWLDNGGHGHGRKMPLILAGMVLGDSDMLSLADGAKKIFQEDRQTWFVTTYDVGRDLYTADGRPRVEYISADVGIPEWGEQHTRNPTRDGRNWDAYYRDVVGHSILGQALTAHLMNAETHWKWPAFLDYADRYWAHERTSPTGGGNAIRAFVHAMWTAYRTSTPPPTSGAPSIVTHPSDASVPAGQTASFGVVAGGTGPLSYQWQRNGSNIGGATSASYTTPATTTTDDGATFRVVVSNSLGSATSNPATLAVTAAVPTWQNQSFTTQTGTFNVEFDAVPGQSGLDSVIGLSNGPADAYTDLACAVRFNTANTIDARNGSGFAAQTGVSYAAGTSYHIRMVVRISQHTYDIYVRPAGGTEVVLGLNFAFRTEQSTVSSLTNRGEFHAIGAGAAVTNFAVGSTLAPSIVSQPSSATVEEGQPATFTVSAGGTAPFGYQWQRDGVNISGATAASYTTPATVIADDGTTFRVVVSNSAGSVTSNAATLTIINGDDEPNEIWLGQDIGSVGQAGSSTYDEITDTFTVRGAGNDIWSTTDAFHFAHLSNGLNGDGSIVARVQSLTNTNAWAKAGVMIRETTAANSRHAMMIISPQNGVSFQSRDTTGGSSVSATVAGITAPRWVKLVRTGNQFTAFYSNDGATWTQVGTARTLVMAAEVEIGLAVTSRNTGSLCTAVFGDVTTTGAGATSYVNGLRGDYFDNVDFTEQRLTRIDPQIAFAWGSGSPDATMGTDGFSVRWTGELLPAHTSGTQSYTLYTVTNDGVRLWVDDQLRIDDWTGGPLRENNVTISLEAGRRYTIKMEFFENTVTAQAELSWQSTGLTRQVIPQPNLFTPAVSE